MYLCAECRDPHTVRWLDEYGNTTDMLYYHGTGALNTTLFQGWDSYLLDMMDKPNDFIIIQARRRGAGRGGWSKNNPYLQDRFVEYRVDIDPPSLASRILSVREQLAREWVQDLDVVINAGNAIMDSYYENIIRERDEEEYDEGQRPDMADEHTIDNKKTSEYSKGSGNGNSGQLIGSNPWFASDSTGKSTFDRNGMFFLRNSIAFDERESSPLRKGNFDLLVLLATQESVHRVLRECREDEAESRSLYEWFRDFYVKRAAEFFDGNQKYSRADDFLEELLLTPPSVKQGGGKASIIDPLGVAERIIRMRSTVSHDWKKILMETPVDHVGLRRKLLSRQMRGSASQADDKTEAGVLDDEGDLGAFM